MRGKFEAKKHAYRQTQDGVVISFVMHPSDVTPELAAAPLGSILMISYSDEAEDTSGPSTAAPAAASPTPEPTQAPEKGRRTSGAASQDRAVRSAGRLCKDWLFQQWVKDRPGWIIAWNTDGISAEEHTARIVRQICRVESRSELATNPDARTRWLALLTEYEQAHGLIAEKRSA